MNRAAILCVGAITAPAVAQACVITPQSCAIPGGGEAYFQGANGSVVTFLEYSDGSERYVVTECNSRSSLAVGPPTEDGWSAYSDAQGTLNAAVFDDQPQSLRDLQTQIARTGVVTQRFTLAANHCGCDLPNIPLPPVNCPAEN